MKTIILFLALLSSLYFVNYKYSTAIRIFAYNEEESEKNFAFSLICMCLMALFWTLYFECF